VIVPDHSAQGGLQAAFFVIRPGSTRSIPWLNPSMTDFELLHPGNGKKNCIMQQFFAFHVHDRELQRQFFRLQRNNTALIELQHALASRKTACKSCPKQKNES